MFRLVSLVLFVVSVQPGIEPLRALANLCIVVLLVVPQRGVRAFFACPRAWRGHAGVLTAAFNSSSSRWCSSSRWWRWWSRAAWWRCAAPRATTRSPACSTAAPLTVSLGVSQWAGPSDELAALMARADAALYRAKANGRNRVEVDLPPGAPRVSVVP